MTDRVAVVVMVDVLDGWADPHNVAVAMVETALSGDPRGIRTPHRLTELDQLTLATRGPVPMRVDILKVETMASALYNHHIAITPTDKEFP